MSNDDIPRTNTPVYGTQKRWSDILQRTLETECSDIVALPDASPEPIALIVQNTYEGIRKMFDAMLLGADVLYPEEADQIVWDFIKGLHCMDNRLCALLLDCLNNDPDILNWLQENLYGDTDGPIPPGARDEPAIPPQDGTCDLDELYGNCVALWDYIHAKNLDFLQLLDNAANTIEAIGGLIEAIPILGELPFDDIAQFIADIGEYSLDAYLAAETAELRQQIICDLFCIASVRCGLTFGDLFDYFRTWFASPVGLTSTIKDIIEFIATASFEGSSLVYMLTTFQLFIVGVGSEWFGIQTERYYAKVAASGFADDDHTIFCDCDEGSCYISFDSLDALPAGVTYNVINSPDEQASGPPADIVADDLAVSGTHSLTGYANLDGPTTDMGSQACIEVLFEEPISVEMIRLYRKYEHADSPEEDRFIGSSIWLYNDIGGLIRRDDDSSEHTSKVWTGYEQAYLTGVDDVARIVISTQKGRDEYQPGRVWMDHIWIFAGTGIGE